MRRARRLAIIGGSVIAVGLLALSFRTLNMAGVFASVTPDFAGTCQAVPGIAGGGDIAVDRRKGLAFIAASDRRSGQNNGARDGLYLLQIGHPELGVTRLAGAPKDFHPYGVSLYRAPDGALTLMAVNRRRHGTPSVDIFGVTVEMHADGTAQANLTERASIRSSLFTNPNDVAAVGPDRFYLTNGRIDQTSFASLLKSYVTLPRANVIYYNGQFPEIAADDLRYADGVALSDDGSKLYVTEMLGRDIRTYDIQPVTGRLSLASDYALPAGLEHIDVDASGNLWVAGHLKLFAYADYARTPADPSPSAIFRVATLNGLPQSFKRIYTGLGHRIGAASVGVFAGGQLLIGSALDDKVLDCTPR